MSRLKSRQNFVPGGFKYIIPQIPAWRGQEWSSLQSLAEQVLAVRNANPFLTQKHGWSLDLNTILDELDAFNAQMCLSMGWTKFVISDGGPPPPSFHQPSQTDLSQLSAVAAKAKNIWAGLRTVGEWIDANGPTVSQEQAEARAAVCVACPLNGAGTFDKWFVAPAAAAIKRQVEKLQARSISTSQDEKLGICEGCTCAMKVKVWVPVEFIKAHMTDATMDALRKAPACWQVAEIAKA